MTEARQDLHVYLRSIEDGERTSLSVLAGLVAPGSRVLDLGTGSGALGKHLRDRGCSVDGVTYNEQEAALARPHYSRIVVADLERPDWPVPFASDRYDFIVCADVLEHLREPAVALGACRQLLSAEGRILISVPNAAYAGLVAELMQGEFTYRDEGLLDRTHLRFFTRNSLLQFLEQEGWAVEAVEPIERALSESEFKVAYDQLPPAVTRYLMALPDASSYQLIVSASPGPRSVDAIRQSASQPARPQFSAQLYLADADGFQEDRKIGLAGVVGQERQVLRFELPQDGRPVTGLRLDPADRPGFLHLYRISLRNAGQLTWEWRCEVDGLAALGSAQAHDMLLRSPWPAAPALLLLYGDDPSIVLPVPAEALATRTASAELVLEVEAGWPMSADYMALVDAIRPFEAQLEKLRTETASVQATARADAEGARAEAERARAGMQEESARSRNLQQQQLMLSEQVDALQQRTRRLDDEKDQLVRDKLALQANQARLSQLYEALANHLRWIESSTVFRATRPLVKAKMKFETLIGKRDPEVQGAPVPIQRMTPTAQPVDIIVPVYRGLEDTRQCIESVRSSRCETPWRLVVLNDASPEPEVTEWLRDVSRQDSRILLLENEENLGFVGTVNRGMAVSDSRDVLLLNSDTEVANDWLDRIRNAAYSDTRVASVTPFSNNATICSYPRFCEPNDLPSGSDTASLDALFAAANAGQVVDVPTGVGFCMYIRRDCLDAVGLFDVKNFGKGYGEENDFCRRAAEAGWRNLHALDTFVLHTGGVSFGDSKSAREREAVEKLRRMHPSYDGLVHAFVNADPARSARLAVDVARVRARGVPAVLAVLHDRAGGTLRHVAELATHLRSSAAFFSLTPVPGSAVRLELVEPGAGFRLEFALPVDWQALLDTLRGLGIVHIHYHHLLGHREEVFRLGELLGVRWDFTAHDFYSMCPNISLTDSLDRYCGEQGDGSCRRCLQGAPSAGGGDSTGWRERHGAFLAAARHVLAPSRDTARRYARMWPDADVRLAPHTDLGDGSQLPPPSAPTMKPGAPLKIVVIGALSRIKGADVLEELAMLAAGNSAPVEFHLIGYAYRDLKKQPRAALTVHGAYDERELPRLLAWLQPDVVWFPAQWPETYSYTLSAALAAALPVVAPDIGSFPERLAGRPWSWTLPWDSPAAKLLAFFLQVREQHFIPRIAPTLSWPLADARVDSLIRPWSYQQHYLHNVARSTTTVELTRTMLQDHGCARGQGMAQERRRLKGWMLSTLVALRTTPALRSLARAIPLRLQTRVKSWLRA